MNDIPAALEKWAQKDLREALAAPSNQPIQDSRRHVFQWYRSIAPELHWTRFQTPLGILYLAANRQGLVKVSYVSNKSQFLAELNPLAQLARDGGDVHAYRQQIEEYFDGRRRSFSLPLDLSGLTDFQKAVLAAIDEIPAGQVRSYGEIAEEINRPGAARAVGQALGSNPIPIVLPCHRVIASDGGLGGYTGGLQRKRQLLKLEGALA